MTSAAGLPPNTAIERGRSRRERSRADATPSIVGSASERPQEVARDDVALDLAGAVPDALDPCIAPQALERQIVHQPHAAEDLQRLVGDARQHLRGVELGLRALPVGVETLVETPGG